MTPEDARGLVYRAVMGWLAGQLRIPPSRIQVGRSLSAAPPNGYGQTPGSFHDLCDYLTSTLGPVSGRELVLSGQWRVSHVADTIVGFMNAVALALLSASPTQLSRAALKWSAALPEGFAISAQPSESRKRPKKPLRGKRPRGR